MSDSTTLVPAATENQLAALYERTTSADTNPPLLILYTGTTGVVKDGFAKEGDVGVAYGTDDPAPDLLIHKGGPQSFKAYVLGRKKFSATTKNGTIEFQAERDTSDPDSWDGWYFYLFIPEGLDDVPEVPVRAMLWKTSGNPAARQINSLLDRSLRAGSTDPLPVEFSLTSRPSKTNKGSMYNLFKIGPTTPDPNHLEAARAMQDILARTIYHADNSAPKQLNAPAF